MINIQLTSSAKEAVLIANSPSFLLRKLQSDAAVQNAAETLSVDELYQFLFDSLRTSPLKPEELTERYVGLVAFAVASSSEEWEKIYTLPFQQLPWGEELVSLLESGRVDMFTTVDSSGFLSGAELSLSSNDLWEQQELTSLAEKEAA